MRGFKKIAASLRSWKFHAVFWSSLVVIVLAVRLSFSELLYEGVSFSSLMDAQSANEFERGRTATEVLGAKAVPILIQVLEEPTPYQKLYAQIYPKLPRRISEAVPVPKNNHNLRRARAAALLLAANSNSIPAIPSLIKVAENDPFDGARRNALQTLAKVAPNTPFEERSMEAVIKGTADANEFIRLESYRLLGNFSNYPEKVVPILLQGLKSSKTRENTYRSLRKLGTNAEPYFAAEGLAQMTHEEFERDLRLRKVRAQ